jgi:hypothetical protein
VGVVHTSLKYENAWCFLSTYFKLNRNFMFREIYKIVHLWRNIVRNVSIKFNVFTFYLRDVTPAIKTAIFGESILPFVLYRFMFYLCYMYLFKVILHQFWVKKMFPWKFNLEYGGTFTKLFMHVSSRNMFPTTRNLQIRVHFYRPRHYCGDWLTFGCFVPMIADHNLVKNSFGPMIADHDLVKKR